MVEKAISNKETKKVSEEDRALFHNIPSAEPHLIKTVDGQNLEAIFVPSQHAKAGQAVFICSGGLESHELHSYPIAKAYYDLGFNVVVFNYRGFGNSTGSPTEEGLIQDAEAIYRFLREDKGFSPHEILGHGYSLGGGIVAEIARSQGIDVVLDRTFATFPDVVHHYMCKKKINKLYRIVGKFLARSCFPLNTLKRLENCRSRVFIFRGRKDISMSGHDVHRLKKMIEAHPKPELFTFVEADVGHFHDEGPVWMDPEAHMTEARDHWITFLKERIGSTTS
ncbi:hypothetical protein ELAC_0962 [Estrella lausannensis]|uniref:Serine aminopeptidase S33 domain-containing protein n=1 Tax=Estrella lausannensis TaxID=483423 RepID=A0A0H5DQF8_9BACT|nr:hypothetical protein ELAC_0962 [Estrella lausannensis]